jgi:hypothetical protein
MFSSHPATSDENIEWPVIAKVGSDYAAKVKLSRESSLLSKANARRNEPIPHAGATASRQLRSAVTYKLLGKAVDISRKVEGPATAFRL